MDIPILLPEARTGVLPPSRRSVDVRKQRGAVRPARRGSGAAARGGPPLPRRCPRRPILGACWDGPVLLSEPRTRFLPPSRWFKDVWEPCGASRPAQGGAGSAFPLGLSPVGGASPVPSWAPAGMARFCSQSRVHAFCLPPGVQDVWEPCGASRPAQGGAGSAFPLGLSPVGGVSPVPPGYLLGPAWDIPVLLSDTAHKLATLIYTMPRYGQEYVDAGAEYHESQYQQRALRAAKRRAAQLGYQLAPMSDGQPRRATPTPAVPVFRQAQLRNSGPLLRFPMTWRRASCCPLRPGFTPGLAFCPPAGAGGLLRSPPVPGLRDRSSRWRW